MTNTTWEATYTDLWDDMGFQIEWNYYCIEQEIYSVRESYGEQAYFDIKDEFTQDYILRKTC